MGILITEETYEQIDKFLKGNLSESERSAFEKIILENNELKNEVIIQKQLFEINGFKTIDLPVEMNFNKDVDYYKEQLRTNEIQDLSHKIRTIGQNHLNDKRKHKKKYVRYFIAAAVALFFGSYFVLNTINSSHNYYEEYAKWNDLPSFIDKGNAEDEFTKAEILYKKKDFSNAIKGFKKVRPSDELYPYSLIYIGASHEQLNQDEQAIAIFDQLTKMENFEENSRGYWYKMLIYLKQENKDKAKEMKSIIVKNENNYNYEYALKIKL